MKRKIDFLIVALFAVVLFASCERVAPNYAGVLMENYGKQGKEDFKIVSGKVSTWELGTELFQVPLFDQRGEFSDPVTLKADLPCRRTPAPPCTRTSAAVRR